MSKYVSFLIYIILFDWSSSIYVFPRKKYKKGTKIKSKYFVLKSLLKYQWSIGQALIIVIRMPPVAP